MTLKDSCRQPSLEPFPFRIKYQSCTAIQRRTSLQVWKHTTLATQTGSFILSSEILRYFTSFLFSRRFIMQGSYRNSQLKKLFFVNKFRVAFHLSRLSGPTSQFLNGTHEFSELVLARTVLLMDQSRSVLPLRSAKARELGELSRENVRALLGPFHLNW